MNKKATTGYFFLLYFLFFFSACTPVKNVVYFQNLQKDTTLRTLVNPNIELKIRKGDLLSINIVAPADDVPLFNAPQGLSFAATSGSTTSGYLVDNDGNILMYKLGIVHVEGLTRSELKYRLQKDLAPYLLKDPVVTIRFLNNHITMLGEVNKPQVISIPIEQITLLEAIGQSGDLTFSGRRDNILIIRETADGKQFRRLNLSDKSIFYSPYYYLKPNDIVYVEPTKVKINSASQNPQIISYVLTGVTILITLFTLLRR